MRCSATLTGSSEVSSTRSGIASDQRQSDSFRTSPPFETYSSTCSFALDPRLLTSTDLIAPRRSYLLSYDAITFHTYLESILTAAAPAPGSAPNAARNANQSPWLYLDAANTLFHVAKRRAYIPPPTKKPPPAAAAPRTDGDDDEDAAAAMREMERDEREQSGLGGIGRGGNDWDGYQGGASWPPGVTPVLEELPKWSLLAKVLEEIEEEISVQATVDLS